MKKIKKTIYTIIYIFFCFNIINIANAGEKQKTFAMIKPSGMSKIAEIKNIITSYRLQIIKSKKIILTEKQFDLLYEMHKDKPFYKNLRDSMVGKEVEVMILYGDNAIEKYRDAIADIRSKYAINKGENAVHGSDSKEKASKEICIFFACKNKKHSKIKK